MPETTPDSLDDRTPTTGSDNPFSVLELAPGATAMEIARQKRKLLDMLELGLAAAKTYESPFGPRPRSTDLVRRAAQQLEEPTERLLWALWAAPADSVEEGSEEESRDVPERLLSRAVRLHYALRRRLEQAPELEDTEFDALAQAWEEALESEELYDTLDRGSDELSEAATEELHDRFRREVESQLRELLERSDSFDADYLQSDLATNTLMEFQQPLVESLEFAVTSFVSADYPLRPDWLALCDHYESVACRWGASFRAEVFYTIHDDLSLYAVDLFQAGHFRRAHDVFCWLRDESHAVGDDSLYTWHRESAEVSFENQVARRYEPEPEQDGGFGMSWVFCLGAIVLVLRLCIAAVPSGSGDSRSTVSPDFHVSPEVIERMKERSRNGFDGRPYRLGPAEEAPRGLLKKLSQ